MKARPEPVRIGPGGSTAAGGVVDYRLGRVARSTPIGGVWLDCGSCDGEYTAALAEQGAGLAVGVEVDPRRARRAAATAGGDRVRFVAASAQALPFRAGTFDGVLLNEVLEHVADERGALGEVRRVLAPGGLLALFSPNRWFPFEGHGMTTRWFTVGFPVPLLPWLPGRLTAPVLQARNYWPRELRRLVADSGMRVDETGWALPLFGHYRWLPGPVARAYRARLASIERSPVLRRFGVSTLVLARNPVP